MPFLALLPIAKTALGGLWSFASSPLGRLVIVAAIAFGYGHHRAHVACAEHEAQARAEMQRAHDAELAREDEAAREIAAAATQRAEEDAAVAAAQQRMIEDLKKWEFQNVPSPSQLAPIPAPRPCFIDGSFADRVRQFDAAGHRTPAPSRRPR